MKIPLICALALWALLAACADAGPGNDEPVPDTAADAGLAPDTTAVEEATAVIADAEGRTLGTVALLETPGGVSLSGALSGLPPGAHGLHIHEVGSCEPPTFESAGSHYAPSGNAHGFDDRAGPHAGDLRNLEVADDGSADLGQMNERVTLQGGEAPLLDADGSAIVIHAGSDDYATQPSGGSGDPIACGVIEG